MIKLIKAKWLEKKTSVSVFLGAIFALLGFITSYLLFHSIPTFIGITTVLFTVIISMPFISKLFELEERLEVKKKLSFFKKHKSILDFFIYFFIGMFIVFFVIAIISPHFIFSEDQLYGRQPTIEPEIKPAVAGRLPPPPPPAHGSETWLIFKNNLYVMLISFVLSLFYGAGAMFLITLNASIFASALVKVIKMKIPHLGLLFTFSFMSCNLGIMFFHMIPEAFSYLVAAIAGGVLSKAVLREKFGSKAFKIVLTDSIILLVISLVFLAIAALIEVAVSKRLFTANVCIDYSNLVIAIAGLILVGLVVFELLRKKILKKSKI